MIEAFFRWIVCSTVMASVLIVLFMGIKLLTRKRFNGNWHYILWILLIAKLIIPFGPQCSVSIYNAIDLEDKTITQKSYDVVSSINTTTENMGLCTPVPPFIKNAHQQGTQDSGKSVFHSYLGLVFWLGGLLILGPFVMILILRFHRKVKKYKPIGDERILQYIDESKSKFGIKKKIRIVSAVDFNSPAVYGFIKPTLIIPVQLLEEEGREILQYAIMHELAHIKRKDILFRMLTGFLSIIHWFNPIIWYGFYKMAQDAEVACDEEVLAHLKPGERKKYGLALLSMIEKFSIKPNHPVVAGFGGSKKQIRRRVENIAVFNKKPFRITVVSILFILVLGFSVLTNAISHT